MTTRMEKVNIRYDSPVILRLAVKINNSKPMHPCKFKLELVKGKEHLKIRIEIYYAGIFLAQDIMREII